MPGQAGRDEMHGTEPVGTRFQAPTSSPRGLSLVTPALLAGGLALRVVVALRPLARLDGLTIPDDAYLCLTIARTLGRGLGPLYTDAFTNGFQPLYVLLMAPFYALFPGHDDLAVHVALVLLVFCDALLAALLCRFAHSLTGGLVAPAAVAAWWCLNPYAMRMALCGMETSLAALLAGASLFMLWRTNAAGSSRARDYIGLGLLVGAAALARIDNLLLGAVVLLAVAWPVRRDARVLLLRPALVASGAGAVLVPWVVYIHATAGAVYPISGRAVRHLALAYHRKGMTGLEWFAYQLRWAWTALEDADRPLLIATVVLLAALLASGPRRTREFVASLKPLVPTILYAVALFLAYPLFVWSFWYYPRYYYPLLIAFLLLFAALADFVARLPRRPVLRTALAAASVAAPLLLGAADGDVFELLSQKGEEAPGYRTLGLWAAGRFPPGTRLASLQTGGLAYFAPALEIVNLDGVVNTRALEAIEQKHLLDYVLEARVAYFVGWTNDLEFLAATSRQPVTDVLERLETIPDLGAPRSGLRTMWWHDWVLWRVRAPS